LTTKKNKNDVLFWSQKRTKKPLGQRKPQTPAPLAKRGKGATKNNRQKGFVKFWHKTFSFVFLFFVLHETKNLSRVNGFECVCTQTLDKSFFFMQFC